MGQTRNRRRWFPVFTSSRGTTPCRQLAAWHAHVVDRQHDAGEDHRGDGATGTVTAELQRAAHSANAVGRWFGEL
ncbi:hypothetical protein F6B43_15920 [Microbacterium rhizomatis]|uniref:Uncharacterized protein n=1 Tax=Microbacterium rhizomatis TaxID=1631477 RepID=A0A5J5IYX6_9MICO|nr:hypothetical protein F6B43_15920 [Microbacterium rhizomatis]